MSQPLLFDNRDPLHPGSTAGVPVQEVTLSLEDATFVGGLDQRLHRWYKLRPSFSPRLVHNLVARLNGGARRTILDPFAGAATTPIEAAMMGRPTIGVEINPYLVSHARYALDWSAPAREVRSAGREAATRLRAAGAQAERVGLAGVQKDTGLDVPPIYNVFRWWREDVLAHLLAAKGVMAAHPDPLVKRIIWLALGAVCIEVANIKRLHPTLTFFDRSQEAIDTLGELLAKVEQITDDLAAVADLPKARADIFEGNSRRVDEVLGRKQMVANVITSPPYCNRYSYVWETRPHLFMMDMIAHRRRATELDIEAIGGTWGSATSILMKGEVEPATEVIARELTPAVGDLRRKDNLMANYAVKYFNNMDEHFDALGRVLRPGSGLAYVVGNSRLKGVDILTENILTEMLRAKPWCRVDYILVFRRRIGRRSLYESTIVGHVV
jgi:hypothetical protein